MENWIILETLKNMEKDIKEENEFNSYFAK